MPQSISCGKICKVQISLGLSKSQELVQMGDVISINETTSYISQIIGNNTVGEIKDIKKVKVKDKVYKIVSGSLNIHIFAKFHFSRLSQTPEQPLFVIAEYCR